MWFALYIFLYFGATDMFRYTVAVFENRVLERVWWFLVESLSNRMKSVTKSTVLRICIVGFKKRASSTEYRTSTCFSRSTCLNKRTSTEWLWPYSPLEGRYVSICFVIYRNDHEKIHVFLQRPPVSILFRVYFKWFLFKVGVRHFGWILCHLPEKNLWRGI